MPMVGPCFETQYTPVLENIAIQSAGGLEIIHQGKLSCTSCNSQSPPFIVLWLLKVPRRK